MYSCGFPGGYFLRLMIEWHPSLYTLLYVHSHFQLHVLTDLFGKGLRGKHLPWCDGMGTCVMTFETTPHLHLSESFRVPSWFVFMPSQYSSLFKFVELLLTCPMLNPTVHVRGTCLLKSHNILSLRAKVNLLQKCLFLNLVIEACNCAWLKQTA